MSEHQHPLERWLTAKKVRPAHFAARIGVSRSYLSELLSGKKLPSRTVALAIQAETAIPAGALMGLATVAADAAHAEAGAA